MRKKRRVALVTGGTGGIGYAVSRALIEQGYNLVLHHRSSTKNIQNLKAFAKKKAAIIHLIQADFTDPVQLEVCVCKATEYAQAMGGIDAAIFCAGVNEKKQYRDITTLDYDNIFSVNKVFRAEPSVTTRHLTEVVSLDAEFGFIEDWIEAKDMAEYTIKFILNEVKERCQKRANIATHHPQTLAKKRALGGCGAKQAPPDAHFPHLRQE